MDRSLSPTTADLQRYRTWFLFVLGFWMLLPFVRYGTLAQDALPYVVAGDLVTSEPDAVYTDSGSLFDTDPAFFERSCTMAPVGTECEDVTVAFVSTPLVLPLSAGIAALGDDVGVLLMRLAAAGALVGGMLAIWRRLATASAGAPRTLFVAALLLTPFATVPIGLGQTSPLLFLSAALGLSFAAGSRGGADDDRHERGAEGWGAPLAVAATWVLVGALKLFPLALAPLLVLRRQWRVLALSAVCAVVLAVATLAVAPPSIFGDFVSSSRALVEEGANAQNPYSGSPETVANTLLADDGEALPTGLVTAVRVALAVGVVAAVLRVRDLDAQWAFASLAVLVLVPLVWWHYLWVAVAAVAAALACRPRTDREISLLAWVAAVTVPISIPNGRGWSLPVPQLLFLVAALVLCYLLATRPSSREREAAPVDR